MTNPQTLGLFIPAPAPSREGRSVGKYNLANAACTLFIFCLATVMASPAQTFTSMSSLTLANGVLPQYMALTQGTDGNFWGTTSQGGTNGSGSVFKISSTGTLTTVYNFCAQSNCTDGANPYAGLVQDTNGSFYGTTTAGGTNGAGTVFKITLAGALSTLYSFCSQPACSDGASPFSALIVGTNGSFYGTTLGGGVGNGTLYSITTLGKLTTLHSFAGAPGDGATPFAGVIQAANGNFYGTTYNGGTNDNGAVYKITSTGTFSLLYSFCSQPNCGDGTLPVSGLVQAPSGFFFGTTSSGAGGSTCGTVFKLSGLGAFTTLRTFACGNGVNAFGTLTLATDGSLYGSTYGGGGHVGGTLFKINTAGKLTTLYPFCTQTNCTDGANPSGGLLQATNGNFYGTSTFGGTNGLGSVFSLSESLAPFVVTRPTSSKVGLGVIIIGNNLTGSTSVTFNGTPATFNVVSSTEITTSVPAGATTGTVNVTTPSGVLSSNVVFTVTAQ